MFGVSDEGAGTHTTYLVDEGDAVGKGATSVISFLHDYLSSFPYPIMNLKLTCDNCCGQNESRFFISYLLWLAAKGMLGINKVELHNMVPGHTSSRWTGISAGRKGP